MDRLQEASVSGQEASQHFKHDVFLSFRDPDTRSGFTSHLHTALVERGIRTFKDDPGQRGSAIGEPLLRAIEESKISIVVLSQNFASSKWCLDELHNILECHKKDTGKQVVPIFYDVEPSDVRNQTRRFAAQFKKFEETYKDDPDKVTRWRVALTEVSNLAGWSSKGRCEPDLIKDIVKDVWQKLHPTLPLPSPSQLAINRMASTQKSYSSHKKKECEVFISFRGKDTRTKFFSHLYNALVDYGISTFRDDMHLKRGKHISSELVKAIKESKVCLVILSPNFASSTWCLDELSEILQSQNRGNETLETFGEQEEMNLDYRKTLEKSTPTFRDAAKSNTRDVSCERPDNKLRFLVNYGGKWANSRYHGGKTKGILVSENITHEELEDRAYGIVGVDSQDYKIIMKAKYESKYVTQPVEITDDDDLRFFVSENLSVEESSRIPLCITVEPQKDDPDSQEHYGSVAAGVPMKNNWTLFLLSLLVFFLFCIIQ